MKVIKLFVICFIVAFFTNGCLVTKKVYTKLLSEKTALDIERQKLKKELSNTRAEKDKKIAEQKNRITTLEEEIIDLQTKYEYDIKVAKERQEQLAKNLQALQQQSSEETRILVKQIDEVREKYERYKKAKNEEIDALKAGHRVKAPTLDQKRPWTACSTSLNNSFRKRLKKVRSG